jgi:hypothetical protein
MRLPIALVGRVRVFRGRCPSCNSEQPQLHGCQTCLGYAGPFPPSEESQRRWSARFERTHHAGLQRAPQGHPARAELAPVR